MKTCSVCNALKSEDEFYKKGFRKKDELRADCKECTKKRATRYGCSKKGDISAYKKHYYRLNHDLFKTKRAGIRRQKKKIIEMMKSNPCHDCGKYFPSCAMDFDHRKPADKKTGISRILNSAYSVDVLLKELDKCDLVCACCHRNRTYKLWQKNKEGSKRRYPSREEKRQFIDDHKAGRPCVECGGLFNPWQMDFDHLDASKKCFKVSTAVVSGHTIEQVSEEIKKCDLVCVNCHRIRTQKRLT